jgi:glycine/serine hydroxymethyltransferase
MKESDMARIAAWLVDALRRPDSSSRLSAEVQDCAAAFPVPGFVR